VAPLEEVQPGDGDVLVAVILGEGGPALPRVRRGVGGRTDDHLKSEKYGQSIALEHSILEVSRLFQKSLV
jgi:hypothetical protein